MWEIKKCPKCGEEMERGYIKFGATAGIRWKDEENGRGELLIRGSFLRFIFGLFDELGAFRCRKCALIVFYY